jgi:hypothetical protein
MMGKQHILILFFVMMLCIFATGEATTADSSNMLFNDTVIYKYRLHFYCEDWQDSLEYYKDADEEYMAARFVYYSPDGDSVVIDSIGVRYKGNSSYTDASNSLKKSYKFNFEKYIDGKKFFGVEKLNLNNNDKDPTLMREKMSYDILRKYMPASRVAYADLYVDSMRIGVYTQVENVDKQFLKLHYKNYNCNLYKTGDQGATLEYYGVNQSDYATYYELKTNEDENNWAAFILFLYKLNNTLDDSFSIVMKNKLNIDLCIRYLAFNSVFSNFDSYTGSGRNFYMYDDSSSGWFTLIPWDMNLSFGAYQNSWDINTVNIVNYSNLENRPLMKKIFADDSLLQVYFAYIKAFINNEASADSISAMIEHNRVIIDSAVSIDSNLLYSYSNFIKNIDSLTVVSVNGSKTSIPGLKPFCHTRDSVILYQIENYSPVTYNVKYANVKGCQLKCSRIPGNRIQIRYNVSENSQNVKIGVYDCCGRLIKLLNEGSKVIGTYTNIWNAGNINSGYYMVKANIGRNTAISGIVLTK